MVHADACYGKVIPLNPYEVARIPAHYGISTMAASSSRASLGVHKTGSTPKDTFNQLLNGLHQSIANVPPAIGPDDGAVYKGSFEASQ